MELAALTESAALCYKINGNRNVPGPYYPVSNHCDKWVLCSLQILYEVTSWVEMVNKVVEQRRFGRAPEK